MNCSAFRSRLEELSTDRFPSDEAQSHIAVCLKCADFYHERWMLNQLIQSIEPVCAPPDFDYKLNARLDAARRARPTPRFLYLDFIPGTASIIFASIFALAVCTAILFKETQSGGGSSTLTVQQTQSVARADFHQSARPAPLNEVPAGKRLVYTNLASLAPKITTSSLLKKSVDGKPKATFVDLRREVSAPEKDSKAIEIGAPQTKSVIFSSGAAPIVTRPTATSLIDTENSSKALTESAQAKDQSADPFLASGVETKTLTAQLAAGYGARGGGGLLVVSVQPQSAAFRAGLRSGDVIEVANNQSPSGTRLPQNLRDPTAFSLIVVRGDQRLFITFPVAQPTHQ